MYFQVRLLITTLKTNFLSRFGFNKSVYTYFFN